MDILLTHAYYLYDDPKERAVMRPYPTLGLLYLSAYLKRVGFRVDVFDATFSSLQAFESYVGEHTSPIVGIYCNLITRPTALKLIRICKAQGALVVVGGPEPANYPDRYLDHGADVVVIGEGEHTLEELIPHLQDRGPREMTHIHGIVYREDGWIVRTPARAFIENLDDLPIPDREAIDLEAYIDVWRRHHGSGSVSLITSRGCPYTCSWCSHAVFGYSHRRRSPENVADEIELILDRYAPDMLWYADDVFTIKPSWFFKFARELEQRSIRIPFETISREDRLNEEIVRTLAEMGCRRIWIGSESGSQEVLDRMKRRTDAERVPEMVHLLQRHGIEAGMFIMLGYEGEEMEDLHQTVARLKQARPDVLLTTLAYPIKGTPYFEEVAPRIVPLRPWHQGSDRDLTVSGRRSRRFYAHATRWLVHEFELERERARPDTSAMKVAGHFVRAKAGRLGMWLSQHEREPGGGDGPSTADSSPMRSLPQGVGTANFEHT